MQKLAPLSAALGLFLAAGLGAQTTSKVTTPSSDPIVISAGSEHIHASQFQALIDSAPAQNRSAMEANKRAVANELGKMLALVSAADQRGLDKTAGFKATMMLDRDNALARAMVSKLQADSKATTVQEQAFYKAHATDFQQTKLRHILISDNEAPDSPSKLTAAQALAKAQKVEAQLKAGANFATLAKADSDDTGSKDKGGELGTMSPGQTVPEFETAVNKLPVGVVSAPIHTRFGYHVVEVESRSTLPFAQAQPEIANQLNTQNVEHAIDAIAARSHVVISDSFFGPKPKTPPTPGGPGQ
ncbi:MAG: peptidylprolyl isomerase [Terriglobales bacterium]